jgi:hypothetical protein
VLVAYKRKATDARINFLILRASVAAVIISEFMLRTKVLLSGLAGTPALRLELMMPVIKWA